jgi:hypothetical protein
MPQGFYRPITLVALQIECEYEQIERKLGEIDYDALGLKFFAAISRCS